MVVTTVLLAEDYAIVAEGLAGLFKPYFKRPGTFNDGRALVAVESRPDVVISDISMPLLKGLEALAPSSTGAAELEGLAKPQMLDVGVPTATGAGSLRPAIRRRNASNNFLLRWSHLTSPPRIKELEKGPRLAARMKT